MKDTKKYNCIVVLGPTASGKTRTAVRIAYRLNGEIISADSRQVYRWLNIGTGKDLDEYQYKDRKINYHLIDIREPYEQFYLHEFIEHLSESFEDIISRGRLPVICGGTGLYLDALEKDFSFTTIKENLVRRETLNALTHEQLLGVLKQLPEKFTSHVDLNSRKRIIRGIEVAEYRLHHPMEEKLTASKYKPFYIGIDISIEERRKKISARLEKRLNEGLIKEAKDLIDKGVSHERLQQLGLEYKFLSLYLLKKISLDKLKCELETAIFQYAKRQMTWFRKMEKEGIKIHWIKPDTDDSDLSNLLSQFNHQPFTE